MSCVTKDRVLVHPDASAFAFRAGQLVERLLLHRSIAIARQTGSSIATAQHVESCLDHSLSDEWLKRVRESCHGETGGEGGAPDGESREAA